MCRRLAMDPAIIAIKAPATTAMMADMLTRAMLAN